MFRVGHDSEIHTDSGIEKVERKLALKKLHSSRMRCSSYHEVITDLKTLTHSLDKTFGKDYGAELVVFHVAQIRSSPWLPGLRGKPTS